ncbi:MAG: hypothetical protein H6550_16010 [Chitinophagales bacterium]|nr:hypothetical protein [Chitinophagales bacterium]
MAKHDIVVLASPHNFEWLVNTMTKQGKIALKINEGRYILNTPQREYAICRSEDLGTIQAGTVVCVTAVLAAEIGITMTGIADACIAGDAVYKKAAFFTDSDITAIKAVLDVISATSHK